MKWCKGILVECLEMRVQESLLYAHMESTFLKSRKKPQHVGAIRRNELPNFSMNHQLFGVVWMLDSIQ